MAWENEAVDVMKSEFRIKPKLWFVIVVAIALLIFGGLSVAYVPTIWMIGLWFAVALPLLLIIWARMYLVSPSSIIVDEEGVMLKFRLRWPETFFSPWSDIAWVHAKRGNSRTMYGRLESGGLMKFKNHLTAAPPLQVGYDAALAIRFAYSEKMGMEPPGLNIP